MSSNVLFIVADDLNAWIGALGRNPDVRTPNIDALAARGTLFTHAYCPAPYCNASRMGVFTGCLPTTTGVYHNEPLWDAPGRPITFLERLRESGFHTFGAGKVFHGAFDYATAGREGAAEASWLEIENRSHLWDGFRTNVAEPLPDDRPLNELVDFSRFDEVPGRYHYFDWGPLPDDRIDGMPDAAVARAVSEFLRDPPREPFFCAAGIYKPHLPWHVPARFFDLYDPEKLSLPLVKSDDLDDVPPIGRRWARTQDHELVTGNGQWRQAVQGYLAAVSYCDHVIGEIVAALDASPAAANTAVVLWGDNGFHLGEKLHWRKFVLWEEATRVPLVVVPPGQEGGRRRVHQPVGLIDLFPTILDLCEVSPEPRIDGASLSPLLSEAEQADRGPAIMTWGRGNHSVRERRWRLTRYRDGAEELYDHEVDPYEWTNLAPLAELGEVRDRLAQWLPSEALEQPNPELVPNEAAELERLGHRQFVGGLWEEVGRLQFVFLVSQGLRPEHVLLDIGCGALRGGVHLIPYLEPGNYLGIDKDGALIEAGISELDPEVRAERRPELLVSDRFQFGRFSKTPDYAVAQSLFTHLTIGDIGRCLRRLRDFAPECILYATFFEGSPEGNPPESNSRLVFQYTRAQMERVAERAGWRASYIGDWGHPRGQRMLSFSAA